MRQIVIVVAEIVIAYNNTDAGDHDEPKNKQKHDVDYENFVRAIFFHIVF